MSDVDVENDEDWIKKGHQHVGRQFANPSPAVNYWLWACLCGIKGVFYIKMYEMRFCVVIYYSYKLSIMIRFLAHPVYLMVYCSRPIYVNGAMIRWNSRRENIWSRDHSEEVSCHCWLDQPGCRRRRPLQLGIRRSRPDLEERQASLSM